MYSTTTGPRRVRRQKIEVMSGEPVDTNVSQCLGLTTPSIKDANPPTAQPTLHTHPHTHTLTQPHAHALHVQPYTLTPLPSPGFKSHNVSHAFCSLTHD